MGVLLSQSVAAGYPDRPTGGGVGLAAAMGGGSDGAYIEHDLGGDQGVLHVRFAFSPATAAGGVVVLCAGLDWGGVEVFQVRYDTVGGGVVVALGTGEMLVAGASGELGWHTVELMIDTGAGEAELWLNGVSVDTASGSFVGLGARRVLLGVIFKDAGVTGDLYLDEWVMADGYVGPVVAAAGEVHGGDPARWLVVYNVNDAESVQWAEAYRAARSIPYANLFGADVGSGEVIDSAGYSQLRVDLAGYLSTSGLVDQVIGVVVGFGVPGYVDFSGSGPKEPIAALLYDLKSAPQLNPLVGGGELVRPTVENVNGLLLGARIDGPSLADALGVVARSVEISTDGLGGGEDAVIWLDPYTEPGEELDPLASAMAEWGSGVSRMLTRLAIELSAESDPQQEVQFDSIDHDGFFWGWSSSVPGVGFFGTPGGRRVFLLQLYLGGATAGTLRSAVASNWAEAALQEGYAAVGGSSRAYSSSVVPSIEAFFEALRRGWTIGEAWFLANAILGDGLYLIGDPLMRVPMLREGWDVYGPLDRLEDLDPSAPAVAVGGLVAEAQLEAGLRPGEGEAGLYVVHQVDADGRSAPGAGVIGVRVVNGQAVERLARPAWPDFDGWPVLVEDGVVRARIAWAVPIDAARVASVELVGEVDGGLASVLAVVSISGSVGVIDTAVALGVVSIRVRWRVHGVGGQMVETAWSELVESSNAGVGLQVVSKI